MTARFSAANRWWVAAMTGVVLSVSIFPGQYSPPSWVWLTSLTLAGLYRFAGRWPLAVLVMQSALAVPLMVTDLWGMSGLIPLVPALTLIELISRAQPIRDGMVRSWTGQVVGSVAWTVALLLGRLLEGPMRASLFVGVALSVALPVLVGLYLHAQRALAQAAQSRAIDAERAEERSAELARSEERAALARELHDLVSHRMASIALSSSVALRYSAEMGNDLRSIIESVHDESAAAMRQLKDLHLLLRHATPRTEPSSVEFESRLGMMLGSARTAGLRIEDDGVAEAASQWDGPTRLVTLDVLGEAVVNAMRYARRESMLSLSARTESNHLTVTVNSVLDCTMPAAAPGASGMGLAGMRERVQACGGTLTAGPVGSCWVVRAQLPSRPEGAT